MVKTKSAFILGTAFLSGAAAVLSLVALGTEQWVTAEGRFTVENLNELPSEIHYGLFSGTYLRNLGGQTYYSLSLTCMVSDNICAYLCKSSGDDRKNELERLLAGQSINFDATCPQVRRTNPRPTYSPRGAITPGDKTNFLSAGLYISTVIFLCISALFGIISTVLSIWNTAANPVEVYLSIYGLYIYNTIACVALLLVLILWGALFATAAVKNVAILETITNTMTTNGTAFMGYSYWLLLPAFMMYFASIALLYVRQYMISQEPEIKIHTTTGETDVGEIMIY